MFSTSNLTYCSLKRLSSQEKTTALAVSSLLTVVGIRQSMFISFSHDREHPLTSTTNYGNEGLLALTLDCH